MTPSQLAASIRRGHTMIGESADFMPAFDGGNACGCALSAAWLGSGKSVDEYWAERMHTSEPHLVFAGGLGITAEFAKEISRRHCGGTSRLAIADWLDTLDVTKPKDAQTFEQFLAATLKPVEVAHG